MVSSADGLPTERLHIRYKDCRSWSGGASSGVPLTTPGLIVASWDQLKQYIASAYPASEVITPRAIRILFDTGSGRSQLVFVSSLQDRSGAEWASIDSPVGRLGEVNLNACLMAVSGLVCGGLAHLKLGGDDLLAIRHVVPLSNLDLGEFEEPLNVVVTSADDFERALLGGGDRF